jgi:Flp pilus assembly protein TadG
MAPPRARRFGGEDGSVAVEFAFIGPLLILVLSGIFTYGGYFLTAHTVQQIANDAARAAIAGLDDDERQQIARTSAAQDIATQTFMRGDLKAVTVTRAGDMVTVGVSYDAREDVYWAFAALLPVPSPLIARSATIRVGGF